LVEIKKGENFWENAVAAQAQSSTFERQLLYKAFINNADFPGKVFHSRESEIRGIRESGESGNPVIRESGNPGNPEFPREFFKIWMK